MNHNVNDRRSFDSKGHREPGTSLRLTSSLEVAATTVVGGAGPSGIIVGPAVECDDVVARGGAGRGESGKGRGGGSESCDGLHDEMHEEKARVVS